MLVRLVREAGEDGALGGSARGDDVPDRLRQFYELLVVAPPALATDCAAQLKEDMVSQAITSYIKADDPSTYTDVISAAEREDNYESMVPYIVMARKQIKEPMLDTTLIYAYAKSGKHGDLEEFISAPNVANIQSIGERCYDEAMYAAAKLLFASINNNAKLAVCYVHLEQYREAVDAATKANAVSTWKEVNRACVHAGEFRLAAIAGLHIIVHPDHLEELTHLYESEGHPQELVQLMEQGLGLEGAHSGTDRARRRADAAARATRRRRRRAAAPERVWGARR